MGTFFPYKVTLVRSLAAGKALCPQLTLCASHSPSVPGGVLESLEYVGPLVAMLFCHLPHFTFPHVDRGKSSGSFQMTFGSTGFQQCGVGVSYPSLTQPRECLTLPCKFQRSSCYLPSIYLFGNEKQAGAEAPSVQGREGLRPGSPGPPAIACQQRVAASMWSVRVYTYP